MDLLGLAEDTQHCIRGLGNPVRRCEEDDCSAALLSNCLGSREKIHRTHARRCCVPVSHCGALLLVDSAVHNLVARDIRSTGSTGPAGDSDLYRVLQLLIAVSLDFEDHCEDVVLPPLVSPVAVVRAATFHPCFGPCLRAAHCRHRKSCLDLANPRCICRIHLMAHWYFEIPADDPVESYH